MTHTPKLPALDRAQLASLHGRSLLQTSDWSTAEIDALLAVASRFEAADRAGRSLALLPDELAYAMFFDNSTRTKSAWAGAASRLGMRPVIVDGSSTQVEHGETAEETGAMLGMNSHAMGIRHDLILGAGNTFMRSVKQGIDDYLAATHDPRKVPVLNLQCDIDHPTQTLADLMWLREKFPGGLKGFKDADAVYPKSWGPYDLMLERVDANAKRDQGRMKEIERRALERNAKYTDWICDERRMGLTRGGDALYMHCLPADIGDEVTPGVMAKHRVNVAEEANKKLYVVMALIAIGKVPDLGARLEEMVR